MATKIADLEKRISSVEPIVPMVQKHNKILVESDEEPSLLEEMRNVKKYIQDEAENRKYYLRLITGIAATNFFALISAFIIWIIKILPVLEQINKMQQTSF